MGSRTRPRTILLTLAAAFAASLLLSVPDAPARACSETECAPPECAAEPLNARPGIDRTYGVYCRWTEEVVLTDEPEHGTLTDFDPGGGYYMTFRYEADEDAPGSDRIGLKLTGPQGTRDQQIPITIRPLDRNRPPHCFPVQVAERTAGLAPAELSFGVSCHDPEHDAFTVEGGGPGVHPEAPKYVPSLPGDGWWSGTTWTYRTKTTSGPESTTYWATDDVGAKSDEAPISVAVGPRVDRLPMCTWNPDMTIAIRTRPGATRRFGIWCRDADGDPFVPRVSTQPERGVLTTVPGEATPMYEGLEIVLDATYVPTGAGEEPDPFSVVATGAFGEGPEGRYELVPHPLPDNGGGGCGYSGGGVSHGEPLVLSGGCSDDDGDSFTGEIVRQPEHGTVTEPVFTPARYGNTAFAVAYIPTPGFDGVDCVTLHVTDGHGHGYDLEFEIRVLPPVEVPELPPVDPPVDLPPLDLPPVDPPVDLPPVDPPVDVPPVDPPVDLPPVDLPPGDPPMDLPQVEVPELPPVDPPVDLPPVDPPVDLPPIEHPVEPEAGRPSPPAGLPITAQSLGKRPLVVTAPAGGTDDPSFPQPADALRPTGPTVEPTAGQPPAVAPAEQARRALRTKRIRLVKRIGDARIYAPRGKRRAIAVSCPITCTVRARANGATRLRRILVTPGRAGVLAVPPGGLRVSIGDAGRAVFRR